MPSGIFDIKSKSEVLWPHEIDKLPSGILWTQENEKYLRAAAQAARFKQFMSDEVDDG